MTDETDVDELQRRIDELRWQLLEARSALTLHASMLENGERTSKTSRRAYESGMRPVPAERDD